MTHICDERTAGRLRNRLHAQSLAQGDDLSDGRLLDRFILTHDEGAFAEIVRRHGPMVLGVCQRVLDHRHDAEDCFQAAFMVLVRKAATIVPREMVGNWLYGVAYRTALEARKLATRRRNLEKKKHAMPLPEPTSELWQDLRPVLDQELSKLPDKYRAVVIACDIEGKTRSEVADQLGVPEGTVASRLARARAQLAKRLHRHRIRIAPAMLASLLAEQAPATTLPETLVTSTRQLARDPSGSLGAAMLADAVVKAMLWSKLKVAAAVMCVLALVGLGVSVLLPAASAERKHDAVKVPVGPKKEKPRRMSDCILRKVDPDKLELAAEDNDAAMHRVRVEPNTRIFIAGKEVKLADLEAGMIVRIDCQRGNDGALQANRIEAVGQSISGVVQNVKDDSLTIEPEGAAHAIVQKNTYDVDPAAKVVIDGKKAKLDEVKKGMRVTVEVTTEPDRVRVVAIISPPARKE